jgi:TolB-like protein
VIRSLNIWFPAWLVLAAALLSQGSAAAQDAKRVAVLEFTGPSASAIQAQVSQGLKARSDVELVSNKEVRSTADRLGNSLDSASDFKEVGEALELRAFVEGNIVKKGRDLKATVSVRDASTGEVIHEETWSKHRSGVKTIKPTVWKALGPAIEDSSVPIKAKPTKAKPKPVVVAAVAEEEEEEEEPPPVAAREPVEDEEEKPRSTGRHHARDDEEQQERSSARGRKSPLHPALTAFFGPRVMWRTLKYEGDTNLNSYKSTDEGDPSFNLALGAQYFPGAHFSNRWYADLGADLDVDFALGLKSKDQEGKEYKTTAYEVGVGAVYRFPLGDFVPRVRVGFVKHVFDVDLPPEARFPSIDYTAIRLGLGTAINLVEWLSFDVSFAYLPVLGTGELSEPEYGDKVSTGAWEAGAGALVRFKETYGVRTSLDFRRYNYDFGLSNNEAIQLPSTGTDSYLRLTIAFMYNMPGVAAP